MATDKQSLTVAAPHTAAPAADRAVSELAGLAKFLRLEAALEDMIDDRAQQCRAWADAVDRLAAPPADRAELASSLKVILDPLIASRSVYARLCEKLDALARSTDAPPDFRGMVRDAVRYVLGNMEAIDDTSAEKAVADIDGVLGILLDCPLAPATSTPCASGEGARIHTLVKSCRDCPSARYDTAGHYECERAARGFDSTGKPASFPAWCPLPSLAATQAPAVPATSEPDTAALRDAFAAALIDVYVCDRHWSAWGVGTMTQDDFQPTGECDEVLDSLVEASRTPPAGNTEDARSMGAVSEGVTAFLEAQDALDNRELQGPNAEDYFVLLRRRNAARQELEAALTQAASTGGAAS